MVTRSLVLLPGVTRPLKQHQSDLYFLCNSMARIRLMNFYVKLTDHFPLGLNLIISVKADLSRLHPRDA